MLLVLGIVAAALIAGLVGAVYWYWGTDLELTIENRTGSTLPPLSLVCNGTIETPVPSVVPGSSVTVEPRFSDSENQLILIDADGREYLILGYVEGNPSGSVRVIVTQQSHGLLTGTVIDRNHYHATGEWALEPEP